jgi:TP901 family phage tail tape measure protein
MAIYLNLVSKFDNKGVQAALLGLGDFARNAGKLLAGVATGVGAIGFQSVKMGLEFNNAFTRIRTLTNLSAEDAEFLKEKAMELGPAYASSAQAAAEGLYFITSAGYDAEESISILESALQAQFIGMGDVATISDLLTSAMYSYSESGLTAESATNTLLKAIRAAKVEPEELAATMGRVLPIASEMGISFEETAALAGILSQGGLDASEAMTSLRGMMTQLLDPANKARDLLGDFGLTAQDVRDSIEQDGLFNTLVMLKDTFGDNEEALNTLFPEVRGLVGVFSLLGDSLDSNSEILGYVTSDVNDLKEAVDIAQDDPLNKFKTIWEETKAILLEIGNNLLPVINDEFLPAIQSMLDQMASDPEFLAFLEEAIQSFIELAPAMQESLPKFTELADVLLPALVEIMPFVVWLFDSLAAIFTGPTGLVQGLKDANEKGLAPWIELLRGDGIPISNAFRDSINRLNSAWQTFIDKLKSAYDWLKKVFDRIAERTNFKVTANLRIPGLAEGGVVTSPTLAMVGEGGQPEAIVPLSQLGSIARAYGGVTAGGRTATYNITVNAGVGDPARIGEEVVNYIKRFERASGPVFASA